MPEILWPLAVSYTHLDVYKRQVPRSRARPGDAGHLAAAGQRCQPRRQGSNFRTRDHRSPGLRRTCKDVGLSLIHI